jgi:hypothetical protein
MAAPGLSHESPRQIPNKYRNIRMTKGTETWIDPFEKGLPCTKADVGFATKVDDVEELQVFVATYRPDKFDVEGRTMLLVEFAAMALLEHLIPLAVSEKVFESSSAGRGSTSSCTMASTAEALNGDFTFSTIISSVIVEGL